MKTRVIVAALVTKSKDILLGRKPAGVGPYRDTWHIPGGGVKLEEEDADDAMRREIKEEAGLTVKKLRRVAWDIDVTQNKFGEEMRFIFLQYICEYESGKLLPGDDMEYFEWVPLSKIYKYQLNKPTQVLLTKLKYL